MIKKHFPDHHRLRKIVNLNTIKLSYSCISNISRFIKQHNRNILSSPLNSEIRSCNCRNKDNCPLAGNFLKTCIVYRADVIKLNETHVYYGASDGEFKYRYNNHTNSFRNQDYENKTELSKHIWQLKRNGTEFNLKWNIAAYATPYRCGTRRCDLCLIIHFADILGKLGRNHIWRYIWFLHWHYSLHFGSVKIHKYFFVGTYLLLTFERFLSTVCFFFSYICWSVNCMSWVSKF